MVSTILEHALFTVLHLLGISQHSSRQFILCKNLFSSVKFSLTDQFLYIIYGRYYLGYLTQNFSPLFTYVLILRNKRALRAIFSIFEFNETM